MSIAAAGPRAALPHGTSVYLDFARITAAVLVLLHHVFEPPFHAGGVHVPGRSAVIVFFVVSGFVIAYASDGESDWRRYAVARLSRIYSVVLPALGLTGLLYAAGLWCWGRDNQVVYDDAWLRLAVSALFLNQNWNLTIAALTNGPYWSLCYEVWYYLMFGVTLFGHPRTRWWALAAVMLLAGPRILLLAPTWLLGALLYRWMTHAQRRAEPPRPLAFALALIAFIVVLFGPDPAAALSEGVRASLDDGRWRLGGLPVFIGGDWRFPSDYVLAVLFALSVRYSASIGPWIARTPRLTTAIRSVSAYTFSVYLFHAPLLVFVHPAVQRSLPAAAVPWTMMVVLLAGVLLLGHFTERRKAPWTRAFSRLLGVARRKSQLRDA